MASRRPQTMAKRAREQAVREKQEEKQAKRRAAAAARNAPPVDDEPDKTPGIDEINSEQQSLS